MGFIFKETTQEITTRIIPVKLSPEFTSELWNTTNGGIKGRILVTFHV